MGVVWPKVGMVTKISRVLVSLAPSTFNIFLRLCTYHISCVLIHNSYRTPLSCQFLFKIFQDISAELTSKLGQAIIRWDGYLQKYAEPCCEVIKVGLVSKKANGVHVYLEDTTSLQNPHRQASMIGIDQLSKVTRAHHASILRATWICPYFIFVYGILLLYDHPPWDGIP